MSVDYFQFLDLGTEQEVDSCIKDFVSMSLMRQDEILTINFYNFVYFNRCKYTVGDVVVTKKKTFNTSPLFSQINTIVHEFVSNRVFFVIEDLITGDYSPHHTGYIVKRQNDAVPKLLSANALSHFYPLNTYSIRNEFNQTYLIIVPKYAI